MKTSLRLGLLMVAAAALPSCWRDGRYSDGWTDHGVQISVQNVGTVWADVHAEAEYWSGAGWEEHLDLSVPPDRTSDFQFRLGSLTRIKVRLLRLADGLSDGQEIFNHTWERSDLDKDNHLAITIQP